MKKLALILTVAIAASTLNTFAAKKDNKISKEHNTLFSVKVENGIESKVYINNNEETGEPLTRTVYMSDASGKRLSTILYNWDSSIGWIQSSKTDYEYNNDELTKVVRNKWDKKKSEWVKQSKQDIQH